MMIVFLANGLRTLIVNGFQTEAIVDLDASKHNVDFSHQFIQRRNSMYNIIRYITNILKLQTIASAFKMNKILL